LSCVTWDHSLVYRTWPLPRSWLVLVCVFVRLFVCLSVLNTQGIRQPCECPPSSSIWSPKDFKPGTNGWSCLANVTQVTLYSENGAVGAERKLPNSLRWSAKKATGWPFRHACTLVAPTAMQRCNGHHHREVIMRWRRISVRWDEG
jgi:hypothetical protein